MLQLQDKPQRRTVLAALRICAVFAAMAFMARIVLPPITDAWTIYIDDRIPSISLGHIGGTVLHTYQTRGSKGGTVLNLDILIDDSFNGEMFHIIPPPELWSCLGAGSPVYLGIAKGKLPGARVRVMEVQTARGCPRVGGAFLKYSLPYSTLYWLRGWEALQNARHK